MLVGWIRVSRMKSWGKLGDWKVANDPTMQTFVDYLGGCDHDRCRMYLGDGRLRTSEHAHGGTEFPVDSGSSQPPKDY